jgi:hypothetical protein
MKTELRSLPSKTVGRIRQGTSLLVVTNLLSKIGVQITPYYLTLDSNHGNPKIKLPSHLESIECGFASPSDIKSIYDHPETGWFALLDKNFQYDKCLCFTLKRSSEIMSFIWCDLDRCYCKYMPFALKQNEAYLFNAYTYKKYRGMNLGFFLRAKLHEAMFKMDRTRLYSITECFNGPALRFEKKLKARHVKLGIYMKLLSLRKWNLTLIEYQY